MALKCFYWRVRHQINRLTNWQIGQNYTQLCARALNWCSFFYFQDSEEYHSQPAIVNHPEVAKAVRQWSEYQDGQRILLTTPSVLVGYRVEVYRAEGTTQWYTAVIVSYNENTKVLLLFW